jgi:hypothetical protein
VQDARLERKGALGVSLVENGLHNRAAVNVSALEAWAADVLSKGDAAFAAALTRTQRRVKIWFDASGRATRVELLEAAKPGDPPDLAQRIQQALRQAVAPAAGGGYVIVSVSGRQ